MMRALVWCTSSTHTRKVSEVSDLVEVQVTGDGKVLQRGTSIVLTRLEGTEQARR
jgi:hypothetical protein